MRVRPDAGRTARLIAAGLLAAVLLGACATRDGGYYQDDGPPRKLSVDPDTVADAVPRAEPPSATGNHPYRALGRMYYPVDSAHGYRERGVASWYGRKFHGRRTSSGEPYDMFAMTAAHRTLPLPSYVRVRNVANGRTVVVRVNDRGPFSKDRIIDLSYVAAHKLDIVANGTGVVEVEAITPGSAGAAHGAPVTSAATTPSKFYVQAGAFVSEANAVALKGRLLRAGFAPVEIETGELSDAVVYRVRVGPIASAEEADREIVRMNGSLAMQPRLVIE